MNKWVTVLLILLTSLSIYAEEEIGVSTEASVAVPTVLVEEENEGNVNQYRTFKSEFVSTDKLSDPSRQTLTDLVRDQVGVESQVYCANCGAKRLTINGLKAEHTSILVDGLPLHSPISSFYGVDNIPLMGLSQVEVMRGTGASLTNPEAIGGTLNLITTDPLSFNHQINLAYGVGDDIKKQSHNVSFSTGLKDDDKKWGLVLTGQAARNETWDEDSNNIAELPQRESISSMLKGRFLLGNDYDLTLRAGISELEIIGGFHDPFRPSGLASGQANESDFIDGNVDNLYIGDPAKVIDWVEVKRYEVAANLLQYISPDLTLELKTGFASQEQTSIYQHGFDYANKDNLYVADLSLQYVTPKSHVIKIGAYQKIQRLRSASQKLFEVDGLSKDNFDYYSSALYFGQTLFLDKWEVDLALRVDRLDINWLALSNRIEKTILAPRFVTLYKANEHLTHRFSYGLGYRAPLTFFESQHGNNESGYQVDITELEKSHSLVYSLSYNTPKYYATFGSHYTHLESMAFGFEELNQPIKYRNSNGAFDIWVNDLLLGYKPSESFLLEATFEFFNYQTAYKQLLPNAAIEQRMILRSTFKGDRWEQTTALSIVPSRDISAYGQYSDHFKTRDQSREPFQGDLIPKGRKAPTFATLDLSFAYSIKPKSKLTFAINNVFDYTQTSDGDSPTTWHWHFVHAHFDGLHTWGPNAGREFILGYQHTF